MKLPAIRAKMGDWTYYVSTLTFEQVSRYVSRVDDELHKSESLKELIQRSITDNYKSIEEYILNQEELFFNALILAVYDDYPDWREIEFRYDDFETYSMGVLEFPSKHKIFPVDGQHRVEGIKSALRKKPELASQKITAIFIGHKNDEKGMQRTRRLFSTLNRYAKPVKMDDIIALDEDDSIAIATRELVESFDLFTSDNVTKSKNKAIPENDKQSITSIITLYQCNRELLKLFRAKRKAEEPNAKRDNKKLKEYLKFRPEEKEITLFIEFCSSFWNHFKNSFQAVQQYLEQDKEGRDKPALEFRNRENGGNLLFRPVGLLPTVQAALEIHKRTNVPLNEILQKLDLIDMKLEAVPWRNVLWNPNEKTMIMGTSGLVKLLLLYMYGSGVIRTRELENLKNKYADKINAEQVETVLDTLNSL
ncbi:MAG: DNA sulfur modification protein DndB [Phaeodactylibacter xiamenensis]|uniref:DGQHR domain-containing protein n=1 Tax=Phaeodactylibacter xiamenensis TaxID=1524460 RepID=A0A098S9N4_9BACT|nr:DNA sulfur modification protein DndB [Phaeodactylibacter xiamenensis]KGE88815.1 hypothetical protein IX84_06690 [Phaeodactylibacter xiamenensis]MCR9053520.1 DGQHR domain-containing protein [bacterium]